MKKITFISITVSLLFWLSCQKKDLKQETTSSENISSGSISKRPLALSNKTLLQLVLSGTGGVVQTDSGNVEFPVYQAPSNINGMLSFPSMSSYDSFSKATGLMLDLWSYFNFEDENAPVDINRLGEEPLNGIDSALGFNSLRYKYELYDFYDHDWEDTVSINVEDDEMQIVLNVNNEVKIGNKYYKYIASNIIAAINNSNFNALQQVRTYGVFANSPDILFFNDEIMSYENPTKMQEPSGTQGCSNFELYAFANNLTPTSTTNQWTVELNFSVYYNVGMSTPFPDPSVLGDYTINWGDGTTEAFRDRFNGPSRRRHVYSQTVASGNSVQKQISVTCRIVNPDAGVLFYCPTISNILFSKNTSVTLYHPAPQDCMWGSYKRKFSGQDQYVGSSKYRLECKIIQRSSPFTGIPSIKVKAIFNKWNGNRWVKRKPINSITLKLRGDVYTNTTTGYCNTYNPALGCTSFFKTLNEIKTTTKAPKLKLKIDLPCFITNRIMPFAINADFIWTYNNSQSLVGNYNEVLRP